MMTCEYNVNLVSRVLQEERVYSLENRKCRKKFEMFSTNTDLFGGRYSGTSSEMRNSER